MKKEPKVSILCITYNQEKYIRETLESFIMQKTDFDFEILIHDDASTDGTQDIIREYENKYPEKIRIFFQNENQYSKGVRGIMTKFLFPHANGKYISMCEGDDFFTDKNKLQLQADFLDKNSDYSLCFHPVRVFFENNDADESVYPIISEVTAFNIEELLKWNFIQTNSVMYRRCDYSILTKKDIMPNDWYLHLYHAKYGKIGFINKTMSAYRRHSGGIRWDARNNYASILKKNAVYILNMYSELLNMWDNNSKYKNIVNNHIDSLFYGILALNGEDKDNIMKAIFQKFGNETIAFLDRQVSKKNEQNKLIEQKIYELQQKNQEIINVKLELDFTQKSKFWKLREIYLKIKFAAFSPLKFIKKYLHKY